MTPRARIPELGPVEIRQAVVLHTYECPACKAMDRICSKGRRLRRTLEATRKPPGEQRINGGPG
ncbi:hypothetical protein ABZ383_18400 [Streptomyces sp. NPDC005900]|uniref:hypothetical protein n=1 Tax=unclassified Streptomyces TaxID=2593676 RepID=UPI0033CC41DA